MTDLSDSVWWSESIRLEERLLGEERFPWRNVSRNGFGGRSRTEWLRAHPCVRNLATRMAGPGPDCQF